MSRLILPKLKSALKSGNSFKWNINGKNTVAEGTLFQFHHDPIFNKKYWDFIGWTGSMDEGTLHMFGFSIPYINDEHSAKHILLPKDFLPATDAR